MPMLNFINSMICLLICKYDSVWQEISGELEYSGDRWCQWASYSFTSSWWIDRWFYTEQEDAGVYISSTSEFLLYGHDKHAMVLFLIYPVYLIKITSWWSVYIWMNTNMEYKNFELYSLPSYLLKMFYNVGRQYMQHTLSRIVASDNICRVKISSWRQYKL